MSHARPSFHPQRLLLGVACCLLARGVAAQAWDWSNELGAPLTDAVPAATTVPDANGFWSLGIGLVHYRPDGTPDVMRNSFYRGGAFSASRADGGVVFAGPPHVPESGFPEPPPFFCTLQAFSAQGDPRWQANASPSISYCRRFAVDNAGVSWVMTSGDSSLYRIADDGAALSTFAAEDVADFAVPPPAQGSTPANAFAYGGVTIVTAGAPPIVPAKVIGVDEGLLETWTWADADLTHRLQKIVYGNDGNVYAAGRVTGQNTSSLVVASVTTDGTQRFAQVFSTVQTTDVLAVLPAPDAGVYMLDAQRSSTGDALQMAVQRIGGDGSLLWHRVLNGATACGGELPDCGFSVTPQGEVLIAALAGTQNRLYRCDANGNVQSTALPQQTISSLRSRADGDALLAIGTDSIPYGRFLELDRSGAEHAAPATQGLVDSGYLNATFFTADDGSSYIVAYQQQDFTLARIDAAGHLLWRSHDVPRGYQLSAAGDVVCVGSDSAVNCYATADGSALFSQPHAAQFKIPFRVLDDGSVEIIAPASNGSGAIQQLFDATGNPLQPPTALPPSGHVWIARSGTVVLLDADLHNLHGYDRHGVRLFNAPLPAPMVSSFVYADPDLSIRADGSMVLTVVVPGADVTTPYAWSLGAHGENRWFAQLHDGQSTNPDGVFMTSSVLAGDSDKVYFVLRAFDPPFSGTGYAVTAQARSASDGSLLWQSEHVATDGSATDLRQDATTNHLLLAGHFPRKLLLTTLDAASGATMRSNVMPCQAETPPSGAAYLYSNCAWSDAALGADGTLRIGAFASNSFSARSADLFALHAAAATPSSVPLQAGTDGAWFASYESGQGFMLDNISNGIFMPWFTFITADYATNDASRLSWYVLQSAGVPGRPATLAITKADAGAFNTGTVGVHAVGTAQLSFFDCNSALLTYQFEADEAAGMGGTIALTRLTPSTAACQLDDTHTAPAQISNAPAGGFDARQSGSWFDPATAGQGVQFAVIPRGGNFGGLVFAAWFTFDPADHADDAAHAHWFTLQGDLANASGGKVELPILRSVGGSLDGIPTGNTLQVGRATLTMLGCDAIGSERQQRARLDYVFDQSAVAHAFAGLGGTLNLVKIGGCATP